MRKGEFSERNIVWWVDSMVGEVGGYVKCEKYVGAIARTFRRVAKGYYTIAQLNAEIRLALKFLVHSSSPYKFFSAQLSIALNAQHIHRPNQPHTGGRRSHQILRFTKPTKPPPAAAASPDPGRRALCEGRDGRFSPAGSYASKVAQKIHPHTPDRQSINRIDTQTYTHTKNSDHAVVSSGRDAARQKRSRYNVIYYLHNTNYFVDSSHVSGTLCCVATAIASSGIVFVVVVVVVVFSVRASVENASLSCHPRYYRQFTYLPNIHLHFVCILLYLMLGCVMRGEYL